MIDARVFDELAENLGKLLPPGVASMKSDFESNAKAAVQSALGNLDLVTREDFDILAKLLEKTMQRVKELEGRVSKLESSKLES